MRVCHSVLLLLVHVHEKLCSGEPELSVKVFFSPVDTSQFSALPGQAIPFSPLKLDRRNLLCHSTSTAIGA